MSLLLPDHDTKGSCVFKVVGCGLDAGGARTPSHSDPLHPAPGDGGWFQRGPGGSFRLDEPRPPLHSHQVGTATLRWLADAHLEVRRWLVNSLLERLRRRLRELGRPLHEGPTSDGRRHSSHASSDDAPPRRTEIELSNPSRSADGTGSGEQARLPAQQPPPPTSTRLKAAVFSKKRHPAPQRQAVSIWGSASFLHAGVAEPTTTVHAKQQVYMFGELAPPLELGSSAEGQLWPPRSATLPSSHLASIDAAQQTFDSHSVPLGPTGLDVATASWQCPSPVAGALTFESASDLLTAAADIEPWASSTDVEKPRSS